MVRINSASTFNDQINRSISAFPLGHALFQALLQRFPYPESSDSQRVWSNLETLGQDLPATNLGRFVFLVILDNEFTVFSRQTIEALFETKKRFFQIVRV